MQAMDRIRDEMAASKESGVQAVGEMVTAALREHPEYAEAIQAAGRDRTLAGLFKKMYGIAAKKQKDRFYYMPPDEAEALMREWYGIKDGEGTGNREQGTGIAAAAASAQAPAEIDLGDLLAGL